MPQHDDPDYYIKYDDESPESAEEERDPRAPPSNWGKIANAILHSSRESREDLYQKVRTKALKKRGELQSADMERKRTQTSSVRGGRDSLYPTSERSNGLAGQTIATIPLSSRVGQERNALVISMKAQRQQNGVRTSKNQGNIPHLNLKLMTIGHSGLPLQDQLVKRSHSTALLTAS